MNTILKYAKEINKDTIVLIILSDGTATCTRKDSDLLSIVLPNYYNYCKPEYIEKKLSEKNINYVLLDKLYEYRTIGKKTFENNKYRYYNKINIKINKIEKIKNAMIKNNNLINIIEGMINSYEKI